MTASCETAPTSYAETMLNVGTKTLSINSSTLSCSWPSQRWLTALLPYVCVS